MLGWILVTPAYIYGLYAAVMLFFETQYCTGTDCRWWLAGVPLPLWLVLFVGVWLPLVPLAGWAFALPWSIPGLFVLWLDGRRKARR
jgi:hypothetical protein